MALPGPGSYWFRPGSLSLPSQPPLLGSMASVHVPCARKGSVATSAWLHLPTPGPLPLAHFAPLLKTFLQICLMDTYFLALSLPS